MSDKVKKMRDVKSYEFDVPKYQHGSEACQDELWQRHVYSEVLRLIKQRSTPCVVYLNEMGELCILPSSHASSLRDDCIVGIYDKNATTEMMYDDLRAL
jgi:hypothetical protein